MPFLSRARWCKHQCCSSAMRARASSTIWILSGFDKVASLEAVGMNAPALLAVADRVLASKAVGDDGCSKMKSPESSGTGLRGFKRRDRAWGGGGGECSAALQDNRVR